ncbi:MAG TPA: NAD(P)/FAD-dependent oxidoreductase [Acidimicrobiia bacterium]
MPRVVVLGAGFGGLQCARRLAGEAFDVTIVDRNNYHLFTPLLYQVASCLLAPTEIAAPLRKVFRHADNVHVHVGDVTGVDLDQREVSLDGGERLAYDHLVIATGSTTNFFGNESVASHALGLKDLGEAVNLRNHVLETLERAAHADGDERAALLTFCIVGGGPTGVEYAGALAELVRLVLPLEYPELQVAHVRIVLIEMGERVLASFHPSLGRYAARELEHLGVEVLLGASVQSFDSERVQLDGARVIPSRTVVWTAGVRPAELAAPVSAERTRRGRLVVDERLRVVGHPEVRAIGDIAAAVDADGKELPMVSPPAMQAGRYVAADLLGRAPKRFHYRDKGNLATIGRRAAVCEIGRLRLRGFIAWLTWLVVHIYYLIGFENRAAVMFRWSWYYVRYERPVRAVIHSDRAVGADRAVRAGSDYDPPVP